MQIRQKLTYQFVAIVALILIFFSLSVYFFSANYREEVLYDRLESRAVSVASLLIDIDEVNSTVLQKIEKDNPLSLPREKIIVYNYNNEVLFSTDHINTFQIKPELLDNIRLDKRIRYRQGDYEMLGVLYTSKYDRFVVVIGAVDIYGLKKLVNLRTILLVGFCICIVIVFIAGSIYSKRALLPISNVIGQVNNINATSMNLRVNEGNKKDEIAKLAETFNNMLDRLVAAFMAQKNFIANASHELRTPLTVISGQLEVLLMQARSPEYYKENITSVMEEVKNMKLVANGLLLLMQASAELSDTSFSPVRVDELLWQAKNDIEKTGGSFRIHITFDPYLEENHFTISGNEQLIQSAFFNLLDNGCKYSKDQTVKVHLMIRDGRLTIVFSDNGFGIPADDLEYIFEPFRRGKNSHAVKGHGIGLSLVQKVIQLHKGGIDIASALNSGTIITISFPTIKF